MSGISCSVQDLYEDIRESKDALRDLQAEVQNKEISLKKVLIDEGMYHVLSINKSALDKYFSSKR